MRVGSDESPEVRVIFKLAGKFSKEMILPDHIELLVCQSKKVFEARLLVMGRTHSLSSNVVGSVELCCKVLRRVVIQRPSLVEF